MCATRPAKIARVPDRKRRTVPLACEVCGAVQWRKARDLFRVYDCLTRRGTATTADVAAALSVTVMNASEKIKRLERMGVVRCVNTENAPGGGRINHYAIA